MIKKIKQSLSLKIILILLIVAILSLTFAWLYAYQRAVNDLLYYYEQVTGMVSTYSEDVVGDFLDGFDEGKYDLRLFALEMNKFCKKGYADMVYIAMQIDEDPSLGDVLMLVTEDDVDVKIIDEFEYTYNLDEDELAVMQSITDDSVSVYTSRIGEAFSFIHGYNLLDEKGATRRVIIGVNVKVSVFNTTLGSSMIGMFIAFAAVLVILIVLVMFMLYRTSLLPLTTLSRHMSGFIRNKQLAFEPMKVKGSDERAVVTRSFNTMAEDIQKYVESVKDYEAEKQHSLAEIRIASDIQKGLLPDPEYSCAPFAVSGYIAPAKMVGGDFYYYERLDGHRMAFAIGDVSGKGVSAALFMASALSAIKYGLRNCNSPARVLENVNNDLTESNPSRFFVTVFVGILDSESHTLIYSNAGHNPPYLFGRKPEKLDGGKGLFCGVFQNEKYEDACVSTEEEDRILLYTDGVTEALNPENEFFGEKRLEKVLSEKPDASVGDILDALSAFTEGAESHDDVTLLMVKLENGKE